MLTSIGDALESLHEMHDERLNTLMRLFSGMAEEVGRFADETKSVLAALSQQREGIRKIPRAG
ncbi:MAG TPA: hypothetical protein VGK78_14740 [Nocardioides sp.]|uniref:hypothetical protein n=1 Tax=Nocardioides sp. TaxID=35761 RepID=UPI002F3F7E21